MVFKLSEYDAEQCCFTCKSKIDFDPIRVVVFEKDNNVITKYFHYFFPCWDPDYVLEQFSHYPIMKAGFSFEEKSMSSQAIMNMKRNLDLWI